MNALMKSTRGLCLDFSRLVRPWHKWETEELCFHLALPLHRHHGTQLGHGQQPSGYHLLAYIWVIIPANDSTSMFVYLVNRLNHVTVHNHSNIKNDSDSGSKPELHLMQY